MNKMQQELIEAYKTTIIKANKTDIFHISFTNGPRLSISGTSKNKYNIEFINRETGTVVYKTILGPGQWGQALPKWLIPWHIKVFDSITNELAYEHIFDLKDKLVTVAFGSKSIGDVLAWMPYVDDFQQRYKCKLYCSTHHNDWFESEYSNIRFIDVKQILNVPDTYAHFAIGWFYNEKEKNFDFSHAPRDCRTISLQELAADILRVPYKEKKPKVSWGSASSPISDKYICIGPHATAACKLWPSENWQKVIDFAIERGRKVIYLAPPNLSKDRLLPLKNVEPLLGQPLKDVARYLQHADVLVGLGSGLSWISWAMNTHVIMIAGFSLPFFEFQENISRPFPEDSDICTGCFNNPSYVFERKNWLWCPVHENDSKQFECQKLITPEMVLEDLAKQLDE